MDRTRFLDGEVIFFHPSKICFFIFMQINTSVQSEIFIQYYWTYGNFLEKYPAAILFVIISATWWGQNIHVLGEVINVDSRWTFLDFFWIFSCVF